MQNISTLNSNIGDICRKGTFVCARNDEITITLGFKPVFVVTVTSNGVASWVSEEEDNQTLTFPLNANLGTPIIITDSGFTYKPTRMNQPTWASGTIMYRAY